MRQFPTAFPAAVVAAIGFGEHYDVNLNFDDPAIMRILENYPNLFADLSCTAGRSNVGNDKNSGREFCIRQAEKLFISTDSGWWSLGKDNSPMPEFSLIDELRLPKVVEDKICRGNAGRIFWSGPPKAPGSN